MQYMFHLQDVQLVQAIRSKGPCYALALYGCERKD